MTSIIIPPKYHASSFTCPFCQVVANQTWSIDVQYSVANLQPGHVPVQWVKVNNVEFAHCAHCLFFSIWLRQTLIFPAPKVVEFSNVDMPLEVKDLYEEASNIVNASPKGACAILRLALQKLMIHLNCKGKNMNDDIAELVKQGLPAKLQQAFDVVRVVGNHSVHPGELNVDDNPEIAYSLFSLLNIICDSMISQPKKISEKFDLLPKRDQENIEQRNNKVLKPLPNE